ncbi:substrate-binding periplasmic protein [Gilvimarinus polysaccharolyticus]|uniref:substrate-binding periplasmic protein n=1 Tax=Gilvimarinus polysaccharolyticus TaxID=863921 RepID=UPI000673C259|nr:transporter substrate-binding domain-containing protein [Gilvimarinus polysaccharolyticus]
MKSHAFFKMIRCHLGVPLAALLVLLPTLGNADPSPKPALKIVTIAAPPWASRSVESNELEGAFVDIVKALEERTDYQFEMTITPFARAGREIERGTQDCTILAPLNSEKVVTGELTFPHPLGAIPRKGVSLSRYEDLNDLRISVLRGGSLSERFDADSELEKVFDTDYATGLRKVARGRVDVVVGAIPTLLYIARLEGITESLGEPLVLRNIPLVFQCSKLSTHLDAMPVINQALRDMHNEGVFNTIQQLHEL